MAGWEEARWEGGGGGTAGGGGVGDPRGGYAVDCVGARVAHDTVYGLCERSTGGHYR
jgi:hypothetical protein